MAEKNEVKCPYCEQVHDLATQMARDGARLEGCVSICMTCGEPAVFNSENNLRKPTGHELRNIVRDAEYQIVKMAVDTVSKGRTRH